jgi:ATP-dependent RNA helicase DDX19/DBP5
MAETQVDGAPAVLNGSGLAEPEYDVEVKLADLQADPNNPLYSVKEFKDLSLSEEVQKGLLNMNFNKPSKIQERALPLLMGNPAQNLIGQSQSGTGKTAAFVLNILSRINLQDNNPQALILAPSRELARQIQGVIQTMGQFMQGLLVTPAIPDPSKRGQKLEGQVIVGTPGTVIDVVRRRSLDPRGIKVLVLDEADNMLDLQGLGDQCKRVRGLLAPEIQVVLFSATFPDHVLQFAQQFAPNANMITLKHEELTVEGIKQFFFDCDSDESKYQTLVKFYGMLTVNSSIIFCKRRDTAAEVERRMKQDGHEVAHLSGALEGADRDAVIDRFRNGQAKVLITTNVLARGIDVSSVTMVVNYDIPELGNGHADPETYLHRIGRTGRFGRVGVAVTFISSKKEWEQLNEIQLHFHTRIDNLNRADWDEVETTVKQAIKSAKAANRKRIEELGAMQTDAAAS